MKIFWLEFFQKIISCAARLLERLEYVRMMYIHGWSDRSGYFYTSIETL